MDYGTPSAGSCHCHRYDVTVWVQRTAESLHEGVQYRQWCEAPPHCHQTYGMCGNAAAPSAVQATVHQPAGASEHEHLPVAHDRTPLAAAKGSNGMGRSGAVQERLRQ